MKQFSALIKRELWENRAFTWLPIVIAILILLQFTLMLLTALYKGAPMLHLLEHAEVNIEINGNNFDNSGIPSLANLTGLEQFSEQIQLAFKAVFTGMALIFYFPLLIVILFYFLDALYSERQDRSILFWKSMPISDTETVLGKLFTGAVVAPLLTLCVFLIVQLITMLILTPVIWMVDGSAWEWMWKPANPVLFTYNILLGLFFQVLWWLPVYAWCLLVSSWTKRSPFLSAVLPVFALGLIEVISSTIFTGQTSSMIFRTISNRISGDTLESIVLTTVHQSTPQGSEASLNVFSPESFGLFFTSGPVWYGLIFAIMCISAAIYIRRQRNEI